MAMANKSEDTEEISQLYARVPHKLKVRFDEACKAKGLKRQFVLGELVKEWVEGKIDLK